MATVLDLLENFLGDELRTESANAIRKLSPQQQVELWDQLGRFADQSWVPSEDDKTTMPALDDRLIGYNELSGIGPDAYVRRLKHRLLYFPRVHVMHELSGLSVLLHHAFRDERIADVLDPYIRVYAQLRELIQRGVLVVTGWPSAEDVATLSDSLDEHDASDVELVDLVRERSPEGSPAPEEIVADYNVSQAVASRVRADWVARDAVLFGIHEHKIARLQQRLGPVEGAHLSAMSVLGGLDLPGVEDLSAPDLVRLRLDGAVFEEWRSALASVVASIPEADRWSESVAADLRQRAAHELGERLRAIRREVRRTSLGDRVSESAIRFGASTAALVLESSVLRTPDLADGLRALGLTTGTALAASVLFRRPHPRMRIVKRFDSLFEEKPARV